jgi:hypothetical protein
MFDIFKSSKLWHFDTFWIWQNFCKR